MMETGPYDDFCSRFPYMETEDQARAINDRPGVIDFIVGADAQVWPMVAAGGPRITRCMTCCTVSRTTTRRRLSSSTS